MCRFRDHLEQAGLTGREIYHPPAYSAQRRAHYLEESGHRVVKSLLVEGKNEPVIALLPACAELRCDVVQQHMGVEQIRLVTPKGIHAAFADCEFGVVPGFGKPFGIRVLMDKQLCDEAYLILPGWTSVLSYRLDPEEFLSLEEPSLLEMGYIPHDSVVRAPIKHRPASKPRPPAPNPTSP